MSGKVSLKIVAVAALALSGCQMTSRPPTATTPVAATQLPPVTINPQATPSQTLEQAIGPDGQPLPPGADATAVPPATPVDVASLPGASAPTPPAGARDLTRDDLIGVWSATTSAVPCSINLSLTSWTGGYRASSRNCADATIASIQAWNVQGRQVTLIGQGGGVVATLYGTSQTRYSGTTTSGQAISLFR